MKFSAILIVAFTAFTMTAFAQKPQKTRTKPSHSEEKETHKKSGYIGKAPSSERSSAAQELRRVEQSSKKVPASHKAASAKGAHTPALKEQKEGNPPIRFAAKGGSGKSGGKSGDELKGRLRHKGKR